MRSFIILWIILFGFVLPSNSQKVSITNTKLNTVYFEHDNYMSIVIEGVDCHLLEIFNNHNSKKSKKKYWIEVSDDVSLEKLFGCEFICRPIRWKEDIIFNITKNKKIIETITYNVKHIPSPFATIQCLSDCGSYTEETSVSFGNLYDVDSLVLEAGIFTDYFSITDYNVILFKESGEVESEHNVGSIFNEKVKKLILNSQKNDRILFDKIRVFDQKGNPRYINSHWHYNK